MLDSLTLLAPGDAPEPNSKSIVLTDARVEYDVPPEACRGSGLRKLTLGQRVKFRVEGEGDGARVTYVNILTLPDPA